MSLHKKIPPLILKKIQRVLGPEEENLLESWAASDPLNRMLLERLLNASDVLTDIKDFEELWGNEVDAIRYARMEEAILIKTVPHAKKRWQHWLPYVAAAAILLMVAGTWFFTETFVEPQRIALHADDIAPGGNRASLMLPDGSTINLSETQTGIIVNDDITYSDGGSVATTSVGGNTRPGHSPLVLTTPRGGTYQITLSDGTKVWLNSASILKYPLRFDKSERIVELIGEAYFEVAKAADQKKSHWPFRVVSAGQTVEVLGTQFNISAYPDEGDVKTTLIEGSVQVVPTKEHLKSITLSPAQQSITNGTNVVVNDVDIQEYISWKDGLFYFNGNSPQEAFTNLSRWYDIEVLYLRNIPTVEFYGTMERNKSLGSLLKILDRAGLEFELASKENRVQLIIGHD